MSEHPSFVPESYINADNLWEKALSLKDLQDTSCEIVVQGKGTTDVVKEYNLGTISDVSLMEYPIEDHDITKLEAHFDQST